MAEYNFFWFRRDLRLEDNAGLYHALKGELPVIPLFIFDRNILDELEDKADARVSFIHQRITELQRELKKKDSTLLVRYGTPEQVWKQLAEEYRIGTVFTNHDYEPYALKRDKAVQQLLEEEGIAMRTFKDHVILERLEVAKADGDPYTVFTPYSRKWKEKLRSKMIAGNGDETNALDQSFYLQSYPSEEHLEKLAPLTPASIPTLQEMGFVLSRQDFPSREVSQGLIKNYDQTRDIPGIRGTSRLGVHFRFGTISIREKARRAARLNETYLNELIWRDFYAMILANFPHVATRSFRPEYDYIEWRNDENEFQQWCEGQTGYPMVDAGMRELNATGFMHNRVRMVTASFLTKHLLIDWRWGEAYFAAKLLDYDLASNNGGWQWAAGSGTDAAPYFRIFNPSSQLEKFDKDRRYTKRWVPEYDTASYVKPIVDHKEARERCLKVYREGLEKGKARN